MNVIKPVSLKRTGYDVAHPPLFSFPICHPPTNQPAFPLPLLFSFSPHLVIPSFHHHSSSSLSIWLFAGSIRVFFLSVFSFPRKKKKNLQERRLISSCHSMVSVSCHLTFNQNIAILLFAIYHYTCDSQGKGGLDCMPLPLHLC